MKSGMRAITSLIILTAGLFLYSCQDDDATLKTGIAFGYDMRDCVCCGGLFVECDGDTLLFPDIPQKILEWEHIYGFPLLISFDFKQIENNCGLDWYEMTYYKLLDQP